MITSFWTILSSMELSACKGDLDFPLLTLCSVMRLLERKYHLWLSWKTAALPPGTVAKILTFLPSISACQVSINRRKRRPLSLPVLLFSTQLHEGPGTLYRDCIITEAGIGILNVWPWNHCPNLTTTGTVDEVWNQLGCPRFSNSLLPILWQQTPSQFGDLSFSLSIVSLWQISCRCHLVPPTLIHPQWPAEGAAKPALVLDTWDAHLSCTPGLPSSSAISKCLSPPFSPWKPAAYGPNPLRKSSWLSSAKSLETGPKSQVLIHTHVSEAQISAELG